MLERTVPATPAWSVRDVLAHVVGLAADLNAQRFPAADDASGRAWTDGQVARGRGGSIADLAAEWDREAPTFEEGLRAFGYEMGSHFVADLHAHYQDVRGALGEPAETDDVTVRVALDHYLGFMNQMLGDAEWGTLEVDAAGESAQLGAAGEHRGDGAAPRRSSCCARCPEGVRRARSADSRGKATSMLFFVGCRRDCPVDTRYRKPTSSSNACVSPDWLCRDDPTPVT